MRSLIVFCHPSPDSFTGAVRDRVVRGITAAGGEARVRDLYAEGFPAILTHEEWLTHTDPAINVAKVAADVDLLMWCDTLIFVYPTWWYGPPAMLKGWLERVLVAGVAFHMPSQGDANITPGLTHINRIAAFTTCGANRWLSLLIGHPGRKILLRGVRVICGKRCSTKYVALYDMNHATPKRLARHLDQTEHIARRLVG